MPTDISALAPKGPRQVEFVANKEPLLSYTLEDGTQLNVKVVLMRATFKGVDAQGFPEYDLKFQQVIDVDPGPSYKKAKT